MCGAFFWRSGEQAPADPAHAVADQKDQEQRNRQADAQRKRANHALGIAIVSHEEYKRGGERSDDDDEYDQNQITHDGTRRDETSLAERLRTRQGKYALIKGRRFRPGWFITVVTIAFCSLTIAAGNWQRGRAVEKEVQQQKLDALVSEAPVSVPHTPANGEMFASRRVQAVGHYDRQHAILLDNRIYRGQAGYHVITPLRLDGSDMHVLVVRGWIAAGPSRERLPEVATPSGLQHIEGVGKVPSTRVLELAEVQPGYVWQNLLLDRYAAWSKLKLQPFVIEQTNDAEDGLVRDWPRPDIGIEKHRIYAMQWYLFAGLALVLYIALNFKRDRD